MNGVSVIICCYNSSLRIGSTLEHLFKQKVTGDIPWEVIVVNNASTDNTAEVAKEIWEKVNIPVPFNIADQPVPGLSYAREKGIEKSLYEYLLFCDDDNWLDENYVSNVFKIMKGNECIGALGGQGVAYFETDPTKSILKYACTYATGHQGAGTGELTYPLVYGAGCTYRKSAIAKLFQHGFRYQLTGRNGNALLCGEDHELCYALFLSGYKIWASDKLTFFHFIPNSRINVDYVKRNITGISLSTFVLSIYKILIANKERERPKYKSKWEWLVAVKGVILIKNYFKTKKKDDLLKFELKAEQQSFFFLLKNKKLFNKILTSLSTSKWINNPKNKAL